VQEIRYSRARLAMAALVCASVASLMFALLLNPQYHFGGRYSFLFNGQLGRFFTLPLVGFTCTIAAVRCTMVALRPAKAIVTDSEGATVTTLWRSYRVVWSELLRVRLEATKVRRTIVYSLKFDRSAGGTISLPLAGLNVPKQRREYEHLTQTLSETHLRAINRNGPVATAAPRPVVHDVAPPPASSVPLRPLFGRKTA
jgi:hypothetical protein